MKVHYRGEKLSVVQFEAGDPDWPGFSGAALGDGTQHIFDATYYIRNGVQLVYSSLVGRKFHIYVVTNHDLQKMEAPMSNEFGLVSP